MFVIDARTLRLKARVSLGGVTRLRKQTAELVQVVPAKDIDVPWPCGESPDDFALFRTDDGHSGQDSIVSG